ncbi:protein of unknown function [Nitrospira japonica]|uniref:Uncharacterized protein n=1 Tax=Nitrospira japonica TaxID=1325564 RepID=A0A1W1I5J1_9BACT|nr:protein of unknown function [Nitrospira japonica]
MPLWYNLTKSGRHRYYRAHQAGTFHRPIFLEGPPRYGYQSRYQWIRQNRKKRPAGLARRP